MIRKILSYIFIFPAELLFLIGEKVRGERVVWRFTDAVEFCSATCTKCGHKGKLDRLIKK